MTEETRRCWRCGGAMAPGTMIYCYSGSRGTVLFGNVPAEVCGQCGESVYSGRVVDQIHRILDERPEPDGTVVVPAYDLGSDRHRLPVKSPASQGTE